MLFVHAWVCAVQTDNSPDSAGVCACLCHQQPTAPRVRGVVDPAVSCTLAPFQSPVHNYCMTCSVCGGVARAPMCGGLKYPYPLTVTAKHMLL